MSFLKISFLMTFFFFSCSKSEEEKKKEAIQALKSLLETKWANKDVQYEKGKDFFNDLFSDFDKTENLKEPLYTYLLDQKIRSLQDGHVKFTSLGHTQAKSRYSGMTFQEVKEGLVLTQCESQKSCVDLKLPLLVRKIDSLDVHDWIKKDSSSQYGSSSQGRKAASISGLSFHSRFENYMPPQSLELEDKEGRSYQIQFDWKEQVANKNDWEMPSRDCLRIKEIQAGVIHLKIKTFWCALKANESEAEVLLNFKSQWEKESKKLGSPYAVILDLRDNQGGGDEEGRMMASLFLEKEEFWFKISHLLAGSSWIQRLWGIFDGKWQRPFVVTVKPDKKAGFHFIKSKLMVLINANCFSTCESVVSSLKSAKSGTFLGARTHGGSGDPRNWVLPHSLFQVSYTTALIWKKNGELIEGNGISPHVSFLPSFKDFLKTKDPLLKSALQALVQETQKTRNF